MHDASTLYEAIKAEVRGDEEAGTPGHLLGEARANIRGYCLPFRGYAGEPAQNAPPAHLRRAPPPPSVGMVLRDKATGHLLK